MAPKICIVYYSMYGHIAQLAEAEKRGIESTGVTCDIYQVLETLPDDVLAKMHAPPKKTHPIITASKLAEYDGFLWGIPTRYGNFTAQWKTFIDTTGGLWAGGKLAGKFGGIFVSSSGMGGGQESTAIATLSTFAHHGIIYVPLGYSHAFGILSDVSEVRGGSPWGAGTFAGADGSRQPSAKELELAEVQGRTFAQTVARSTQSV